MKEQNFALRLFSYLKPYKKKVILLVAMILSSSALNVVPPLILQYAIDEFIIGKDLRGLVLVSFAIFFYGIILGVQGYYQKMTSQFIGHNVVRDIRDETFDQINHLSFSYFDKTSTGDMVSRIMSDTERLRMFMSNGFVNFIINFFMLIGILIVMFVWNVQFGLIFVGTFPFLFGGMFYFTKKVMPANRRSRKSNSLLTASIQECFNGIKEVKLYGREDYMYKTFKTWNDDYFDAVIESNKYNSIYGPYIPFILNICTALFLMAGGLLAIEAKISIGLIIASVAYFGLLTGPIRGVTAFANTYNWARAAAERVFEVLDQERFIKDIEDAEILEDIKGEIEFKDVWFEYDEGNPILKDINLTIKPGEVVALVGPSGVGKTTIAHLVPRFYDVKSGSVCVDGVDVRNIDLTSLRKHVGIVMQNIFLFDGTIADNIAYGIEDVNPREVMHAIKIAQLSEFIKSLPHGHRTHIGERGVKVSGGQAPRISLARVLVTNPKMLIMDEPTSNVDAITDQKLMEAVRTVMKGKTTLVIAHRLWTIKNADRIVLLKDGMVKGIGSHQELLENNEFYREFFALQFDHASTIDNDIMEGENE